MKIYFNRMEIAGSLGDLGTLLPLALGMILINGLDATGLFFSVGLFYVLAGMYYRVPVAVQPMKVVAAYALATGASALQVQTAALLMAFFLLLVGATGFIRILALVVPRSVVRGVQISSGMLLTVQGLRFILGQTSFQALQGAAEPYLRLQAVGPVPLSIVLGLVFALLTLALLDSKRFPAGLVVVLGGLVTGLVLSASGLLSEVRPGIHWPGFFPDGLPTPELAMVALASMVLPQLPMTLGNAVFANADLSLSYYPEGTRVTPRALCMSMGLACTLSGCLGGMPLCHGAGGLAAHYRFGARTAGSNLIVGGLFLALALVLGPDAATLLHLLPLSVLGVLLVFAGLQLCLTILDMKDRKSLFVIFLMLALTLALNLALAFGVGLCLAWVLKSKRFSV